MKLSSASVYIAILFSSVVFAGPVSRRQDDKTKGKTITMGNSSGNTGSKGAAYFITNEPDSNFIVSADIGSDGKLTLRQAVATGGRGLHGGPTADPDALFSQGAVKVSSVNGMLAAVNAGSNTISVFSIDQNDPAKIERVGSAIGSGGEFPVSVAFNKAGDRLCSLNGGEVNSVSCFKVDKQIGLVPVAGTNRRLDLNQTTPATGPAGTASQLLFSEDEKQLVVSVKGVPPKPGFFAVWDVDQKGSLSKDFRSVTPAKGGVLPFSMTLIPGTNAILSTDPGVGFTIFDMSGSSNSSSSAAAGKSSAVSIDGQVATCWSSFSPKTGNFYLTDIGTSNVIEVKIEKDTLKGSVVKKYSQGSNSGTIDNNIASIGDKDFLYVLSANATRLDVLSLDAPGQANNIQKLDLAGPAKASGLKINGSNVQGMTTFIKK